MRVWKLQRCNAAVGFSEADFLCLNEGKCGFGGVDSGVSDLLGTIFVEGDAGEGVGGDFEAHVGSVDEAEEGLFDELEVAVVAGGHFGGDGHDALEVGGGLGAVGAEEFEDVGVALLGHDA